MSGLHDKSKVGVRPGLQRTSKPSVPVSMHLYTYHLILMIYNVRMGISLHISGHVQCSLRV